MYSLRPLKKIQFSLFEKSNILKSDQSYAKKKLTLMIQNKHHYINYGMYFTLIIILARDINVDTVSINMVKLKPVLLTQIS